MIRVMYSDGRFDMVKAELLDALLEEHSITSFKRATGWAVVGRDPLRGSGNGAYRGAERRRA